MTNNRHELAKYLASAVHGGWRGEFEVWETYADPEGTDGVFDVRGTTPDGEDFSAQVKVLWLDID